MPLCSKEFISQRKSSMSNLTEIQSSSPNKSPINQIQLSKMISVLL